MKKNIYFIPGMWASSKIFERIHLPSSLYDIHYLEWLMPLSKNESLASYCHRFSKLITAPNPIFIGVSFGGIIAQELSHKFPNAKVIIISSIKHPNEKPLLYRFSKKTKTYPLFPITCIHYLESILDRFGNLSQKKRLATYRKYLPIRNTIYTKWAIGVFLNWTQKKTPNLLHIHGDNDRVLPLKNSDKTIVIPNGTHSMVLTKSNRIQNEIRRFLD